MLNKLTLSRRRPISCRNQSIDLLWKSMDWFLYDIGLRRERVKRCVIVTYKHGIYELPQELPNDLRIRKLGNSWETRKYQESI